MFIFLFVRYLYDVGLHKYLIMNSNKNYKFAIKIKYVDGFVYDCDERYEDTFMCILDAKKLQPN